MAGGSNHIQFGHPTVTPPTLVDVFSAPLGPRPIKAELSFNRATGWRGSANPRIHQGGQEAAGLRSKAGGDPVEIRRVLRAEQGLEGTFTGYIRALYQAAKVWVRNLREHPSSSIRRGET